MQPSKPRHGSSEMAKVSSPSASRSPKGSPSPPDVANPRPPKFLERKLSHKGVPSQEKCVAGVSEVQQQLIQVQEALKRAMEEKALALEEVNEMRQALSRRMEEDECLGRIKMLEVEVEKAKESERSMLESLVSQTKLLEGTKIELEEAKLEIRNLRESIRHLEGSVNRNSRNLDRCPQRPKPFDSTQSLDDVARLRSELRLAFEAEEKNKKALDDLAFALKEVNTEMNQVKEKLSVTQSDLDRVREDAEHSKLMLSTTEEKLGIISEEAERLRLESDESAVAWNAKESGFINCMKVSEEEITKLKRENCGLVDSERNARVENSKLRDIMKQALNEATVVKGALEIARSENSELKDLLLDKENSLKSIKQECECLKLSEAAAIGSVKELKNMLAEASSSETKCISSVDASSLLNLKAVIKEASERKGMAKFPSEPWISDNLHIGNGLKGPVARSASFMGSMSERVASSGQKDSRHASFSCVSDLTASTLHELDNEVVNPDSFDHRERIHLNVVNNEHSLPTKQKKKPILRKFGELLRRGNLRK